MKGLEMILVIVYTAGRFGPEKIHGYAVVEDAESLHETTHLTYDIVSRIDSLNNLRQQIAEYKIISRAVRVTNPKGISNLQEYRKWQRRREALLQVYILPGVAGGNVRRACQPWQHVPDDTA